MPAGSRRYYKPRGRTHTHTPRVGHPQKQKLSSTKTCTAKSGCATKSLRSRGYTSSRRPELQGFLVAWDQGLTWEAEGEGPDGEVLLFSIHFCNSSRCWRTFSA